MQTKLFEGLSREEALMDMVQYSTIGLWEIMIENGQSVIHMDECAARITDMPPVECTVPLEQVFARYHKDDVVRIQAEIAGLFEHPGESRSIEYRVWYESKNDWHWLRSFAKHYPQTEPGRMYLFGSTQDMQDSIAFRSIIGEVNAANERVQVMLDTTPLCCNFWNSQYKNIDCNAEAVTLFGLSSRQEYLDRFADLSPEFQPDGRRSSEKALALVREAFEKGRLVFEWMHQTLAGERIPCEITLVRVERSDGQIVLGYTRDLRETKKMQAEMAAANERAKLMLDATPLCCTFWDEDFRLIDCNEEAVHLFGLRDKQEFIDRFYELMPKRQPSGRLSTEMVVEYNRRAVKEGKIVFEWMHQTPDGEPIPSELTLVRVRRGDGYNVIGYTRDLRETMQMRAEMDEANERAKIMLDATPLCCNFWDEDFNNIDCNQEAVSLFDLRDKQEYLDRFFDLSPEYQPCGRPSSELAVKNITAAFQNGRIVFEWMHQKLNGEPVPCEITLVRVLRGDTFIVVGYTRDLRETKKLQAEMDEANERTKIMLDATPLCCNLWDEKFNNIDCNQEAVNLFELRDKQEYLDRFFELSPEFQPCGRPTAEMAIENITTAFRDGRIVFEWMHQKLNGEPVPAEITLVRVKRGNSYIVAGYTRDLREYKKMIAEVRQVEADLRLARDAAQESAHSKSEFLANMSHEIRTPMNAILGMLHIIQSEDEGTLTAKQSDFLKKTEQSAKTLLRIINDILDFSKIEAGKLEMECVDFTLGDIFRQMTDMFEPRMQEKGLTFALNLPDSLPKRLRGDPLRLAQVLLNLIGNSVKFTEKGGITLSVSELARGDGSVTCRFSVRDTGIGMSSGQVRGLFEPFTQADSSTTRKYGGTGLGLAICKKLVNLMHGDIWCESAPGEGTTFLLTAVFVVSPDEEERVEAAAPAADPEAREIDRSRIKPILLAEDNEINQIIAQELLQIEGYQVDIAENGEEAIAKLIGGDYELVLMDIQMPVMDGITATAKIRKMPQYDRLPIIAMTAHAMSGDHEKSLAAGMDDHVTKPIEPEKFSATLKKWIRKNQGI